jgi:hypothetical protein
MGLIGTRVRPFRFKKFFASKRKEANRDLFHMSFACSLKVFASLFFAIFSYFRIKFFALFRFINF